MAESMSWNEAMMRRRDFSGAHEWRGADWLIRSRMVRRCVGWKIAGSWRFLGRVAVSSEDKHKTGMNIP